MPASTRGVARSNITFVQVSDFLAYGWNSADLSALPGITTAELADGLGHKTAETVFDGIVRVIGANAPKPARVTKPIPNAPTGQRASVSTFVAYNKLAAASLAGWRMQKPASGVKVQPMRAGARTFTGVMVLSNSLWYAQPVDAVAATDAVRDTLGILLASQVTTNGRKLLVRGSRSKPAYAAVPVGGGDAVARLPVSAQRRQNTLDAGYSIVQEELITYPTAVVPF